VAEIAVVRQACPTTTGTQNFTVSGFGTPKAAMVIVTYAITDSTQRNNLSMSLGFTDGTRNRCVAWQSEHNVSRSDCDMTNRTTSLCRLLTPGGTNVELEGDWNAWVTDGIQIDWTSVPAALNSPLVTVILFGGNIANAHVNNIDLGTTHPATIDVTDPGFRPDVVIGISTPSLSNVDINSTGWTISAGICQEDGAGTESQACIFWGQRNNQNAADIMQELNDSFMIRSYNVNNYSYDYGISLDAFDANGFSCVTDTGSPGGADLHYLALDFGTVGTNLAVEDTRNGLTGTKTYTPGWNPQALIGLFAGINTVDTLVTTNGALQGQPSSFGFGVSTDADDEFANFVNDEDGATTMDTGSETVSGRFSEINSSSGDGVEQSGTVSDWTTPSNGYTINWTVVPTSANKVIVLAVESAVSTVTGTADFNLPALTVTADGDVLVTGIADFNLPALTVTADGAILVQGDASISLPALTVTADGIAFTRGNASITFPIFKGVLGAKPHGIGSVLVQGDATPNLPALTVTADGAVLITGASGPTETGLTFPAWTTTADAAVLVQGDASISLPALTVTAAGVLPTVGIADFNLPVLTLTADGVVLVQGDASVTFPAWTTTADASVVVEGEFKFTPLPALVVTADGSVLVQGDASISLPALTVTATGSSQVESIGTADFNLPVLTLSADGAVLVQGDASVTLPALTLTADGSVLIVGDAAVTFPAWTLTGAGAVLVQGDTGSALTSLYMAALEVSADGSVIAGNVGNASISLPVLTLTADGVALVQGDATITFPVLALTADGSILVQGDASLTLPALTVAATGGVPTTAGSASLTFPALSVSATGAVLIQGATQEAGIQLPFGSASESLPNWITGIGGVHVTGAAANLLLQPLGVQADGQVVVGGAAAILLPALSVEGIVLPVVVGDAALVLPALTLTSQVFVSGRARTKDYIQEIQLRFANNVIPLFETAPVVVYDGDPRKLPDKGLRVRLSIRLGDRVQVSRGSRRNRYRVNGVAIAQWFSDVHAGPTQVLQAAKNMDKGFRGGGSALPIRYHTADPIVVGEREGAYQWNVSVPFSYDEVLIALNEESIGYGFDAGFDEGFG
jgi:formylmethanofuran dehydrogenase subunit C